MTSPKDGIFNIDKPTGITSMEVVRQIKRHSSQRHAGHAGTLDPLATGVLPVCLGQATRLMQFLVDGDKEYLATVCLGITTDTYDKEGQVLEEHDASNVTLEALCAALEALRGTIQQTPPMYSALKLHGRRLHELARAGVEVLRAPRTVQVKRLDLTDWTPPFATLSIQCGRGVYIRSMAYDLGELLGCGAHLTQLRRMRTGPFRVSQTVPLQDLSHALQNDSWQDMFFPPDYAVLHMEAVTLTPVEERTVRNGQPAALSPRTHYAEHMETRRAYSADGRFVALLQFHRTERMWQPVKVFDIEGPSPYKPDNP